jgi:transcriptional regulator with XRE-family HTH domain
MKLKFAENLRKMRRENGFTQEQLAEMMNVSQNYIANIECGKTNISRAKILELSKFLNVNIGKLLDFD